jgi:type VI secretion system protein ImpK
VIVAEMEFSPGESVYEQQPENLALVFQEVLTAIMRLRTNRQPVSDTAVFRAQFKEALEVANKEASRIGYGQETIRLAIFAVVAFLDESALNKPAGTFPDWASKPLQEELFGTHIAGEIFFENLKRLLAQSDSAELADVLEVHHLCLLLGYRGRYGSGSKGEFRGLLDSADDKIRRIRGRSRAFSPGWGLPRQEVMPMLRDVWARRILVIFAACLAVALLLFVGLRLSLASGVSSLTAAQAQSGK